MSIIELKISPCLCFKGFTLAIVMTFFFLGNNDYSSDAVDFFRQLAPKEKMFKFKFDKTKEQTYPMTIEMFMDENCQKTFAEVLIRRQFVKSIDPPPEWNPMAADYQKPGNLLCPTFFDSTLGLFTK